MSALFDSKFYTIALVLILCSVFAHGQTGYYQPFSIGLGYGGTVTYAGEQTITSSSAANLNFNYHITPFTSISIVGQFGQLSGGDALTDTYGKQFINDYKAIIVHADIQLGELIDYSQSTFLNGIKNIYGGIGAGIISNNISANTVNPADYTTPLTYIKQSTNILVPVRLGYEFKIFNRHNEPQLRFDINYSFNTAFGKGLDGYYSIYSKSKVVFKFYDYLSVGVKYCFGAVRPYRKQIYYSAF